jgi:hypothetical protein
LLDPAIDLGRQFVAATSTASASVAVAVWTPWHPEAN